MRPSRYNSKRRRVLPCGTIEKFCKRCERWRPLSELERDKHAMDGFGPRCRACWNHVRKVNAALRPAKRPTGVAIGDVARELGVDLFVLHYWENEFRRWLRPVRSEGGKRFYQEDDVENAKEIYRLVRVELYTLAGARRQLSFRDERRAAGLPERLVG